MRRGKGGGRRTVKNKRILKPGEEREQRIYLILRHGKFSRRKKKEDNNNPP